MSVRATALEALHRYRDALRGGRPAEADTLLSAAIHALEHRPRIHERLAQLQSLEQKLAYMTPGDRATAIRERMGLSKSAYYRLRRLAFRPVPLFTGTR